ncbi:hypothetical protein NEIRO02_2443 [Nematocida sp. AWRm79]|nr:hypothetical protein NEIRO02_2443 [Nematocida sp. AWRm79]
MYVPVYVPTPFVLTVPVYTACLHCLFPVLSVFCFPVHVSMPVYVPLSAYSHHCTLPASHHGSLPSSACFQHQPMCLCQSQLLSVSLSAGASICTSTACFPFPVPSICLCMYQPMCMCQPMRQCLFMRQCLCKYQLCLFPVHVSMPVSVCSQHSMFRVLCSQHSLSVSPLPTLRVFGLVFIFFLTASGCIRSA